jgi:hypothetical protein
MNKDIMRQAGFGKEVDMVEAGLCPFCGQKVDVNSFRDEVSKKEFHISGMCQKCQDKTFSPGKV